MSMKTLQTRPVKTPKAKSGSSSLLQQTCQLPVQQPRRSGDWLKLAKLPSVYSFDEALLLCETEPGHWLAWVPDFGELLIQI
jgi:hypothetical protein